MAESMEIGGQRVETDGIELVVGQEIACVVKRYDDRLWLGLAKHMRGVVRVPFQTMAAAGQCLKSPSSEVACHPLIQECD